MLRDILKIDEKLCNGCGLCVPNCHEGALQVIDGKVRLVSELMCDGLGACIGHCPEGAITIEKREAQPYNETRVIEQMADKGKNTIIAHLRHLKDHGETGFLQEGVTWLKSHKSQLNFNLNEVISDVHNHGRTVAAETLTVAAAAQGAHQHAHNHGGGGCPGSRSMVIEKPGDNGDREATGNQPSELRQWPVQMHLVNPNAPYFRGSDLLLAADCVAFSMGSFHSSQLKGKSLAIACPKLDQGMETYVEKLSSMIDIAKINTITVMMMEVPCCGGLLQMVKAALANTSRKVPVKKIIVGINGEVLQEEWV
ncbi:MAG: 4Fe-4S ferredoxin [Bacteroidetes bacterium GWF2_41_9]|nr:MAG: 4Fe-4S ferredoxin [Bacteroidetes bacterium GWA2_40_15]OFX86130.1 MAG: 4Fe-4S ferredoxin [Bacteroidetes bacterium GWC2_40_22]OFY59229.1 MAG: 4Fe-4S ferredoxin [Bacteroidetes bacterium GWF2_41_9]HAM10580.1 4Fe-4S ferredoxin [Bacteroidales bacterium]HBQ82281.1 4Fe-4S ferredoxin [Bacteroidales bacterium]